MSFIEVSTGVPASPSAVAGASAGEVHTPLFAEPEATYAVVQVAPPDDEEQRAGVERTRAMLIRGDTSESCVAILCPCVSIAQISSSVGGSYLLNLIGYAVLYLGGLQLLVLAMRDLARDAFGIKHVVFAILLEIVFFVVGPCISAPAMTTLLVCYDLGASLDENPETKSLKTGVYYYMWGDMVLDFVFACFAYAEVSTLRHHVNARNRSCCRHCSGMCCVWVIIGNASASAKQYARNSESYLGPLDTIPAFS